jgi:hypothetical protein
MSALGAVLAGTVPALRSCMTEHDFDTLATGERQVLDRSFQPKLSEKRTRNIALSALMTAAGLALVWIYGVSAPAITGISLVILVVSAVEKVSYAREILVYKSLVRKLVHRVEELQQIELTPLEGHPAARAQRRAEIERAHA